MLVLQRDEGERVVLQTTDGPITVEVVRVQPGGHVRIGFTAPDAVTILRAELLGRTPRGRRQAGMGGGE